MRGRRTRLGLTLLALAVLVPIAPTAASEDPTKPASTPGIPCEDSSLAETGTQGDIPAEDVASGRMNKGYFCNAQLRSHTGVGGGFRIERYVDKAGHVCAYFDSGTLFPGTIHPEGSGVWVLDMADPAKPRLTATLSTAAMLTPHESLRLNQKRGLLAAVAGNLFTNAGIVDVYSVADDCRAPTLLSSTPLGILGHESAFAPDGNTFYATSIAGLITAIDVSNPASPSLIWTSTEWGPHGVSVSDDGNTLFMADQGEFKGLVILDVSQVQARTPNPVVPELSRLTWPEVSIPQNATPFRSRGHDYVVETDEFGGGNAPVGAARIINVDDLHRPRVVSHLRLAVHNQQNADKTAHYCTVPSRIDPYIIACGMLYSGLRIFDIRDVTQPVEVAYANVPDDKGPWGSAYSAPAYDPENNDVWYSDGPRGFYVIHLTPGSGVKRFARDYALPGS